MSPKLNSRQTILLADDSATIQRLVIQTFADTRFDIVSVSNGDAAIRKFEEIQPSAVLADIYMPGKNGFEVCAYIKSHATLSSTPVILLVGAFDAFDEATADQAGAAAHITKPFEPRALIELVGSFLPLAEDGGDHKEQRERKDPEPRAIAQPLPRPEPMIPAAEVLREMAKEVLRELAAAALPVYQAPPVAPAVPAPPKPPSPDDLMGLELLFQPEMVMVPAAFPAPLGDEEIDRIAERVIQKLSTQIIENIAWDVVPDIVAKVLRDELKRTTHEG